MDALSTNANVLLGVGAVAVGLGALLWAYSDDDSAPQVLLTPNVDGALVGWRGSF